MAEPKVTTLFETPAPSPVGDVLFDIFKKNEDMETYAKKKDIDTNAAIKLKSQENQFDSVLAATKHKYDLDRLERQNALTQANLLQLGQAQAEQIGRQAVGLSERTGEAIPGLTERGPAPLQPGVTFERPRGLGPVEPGTGASYSPVDTMFKPKPINPLASGVAGTLFAKEMDHQFNVLEEKTKQSFKDQRDALNRTLGLATTDERAGATDLANLLESIDKTDTRIPLLRGMAKSPNTQSDALLKFTTKVSSEYEATKQKLQQIKVSGDIRANISAAHDARWADTQKMLQDIKAGGKAADKAMTNLAKEQSAITSDMARLQAMSDQYTKNFNAIGFYENSAAEAKARTDQQAVNEKIIQMRGRLTQIEAAMNYHNMNNMAPSVRDQQDEMSRRRAFLTDKLKGRDPKTLSQKERDEINAEYNTKYPSR